MYTAPLGEPRLAAGLYSSITSIPAGFSSRYAIFASTSGVSAATFEYGAVMQRAYGTQRLPLSRDLLNRKLSYWSDNGATLFQSFWDVHCPTRNCTAVSIPNGTNGESMFLAAKAAHEAAGLPVGIYQFDTWWFPQWADFEKEKGSLDATDWYPRPDLFPNGLSPLIDANISLLLYSWGWVTPEHGNTMSNFTWIPSPDGTQAMVALDQVYDFYSMIRDRFLAFGGTSYESDNMGSWTGGGWAQTTAGVDTASTFWRGWASPFCEAGIPMQACEASASDMLETLRYGCITSLRDTIDDVPGAHADSPLTPGGNEALFAHRWHVGNDRLLMAALAQRPFFDNVWSTKWQNQSTWAGKAEEYVELAWIMSVLTAGAVGFGDYPGDSNTTLIMTSCHTDGVLLTASLPSHYLDDF